MTRRPPRSSRPYTPCPYTPLFRSLPNDTLVGLDLGMSLPYADAGAFFPSWIESPADARSLWAMVDGICESDPYLEAGSFVDHARASAYFRRPGAREGRSEEHTSELQSLMRLSYAVFCLTKKK